MLEIDPRSRRENWPISFEQFDQLTNAIDSIVEGLTESGWSSAGEHMKRSVDAPSSY